MKTQTPYDVVIVGGGVNGAGVARDAAGRGLSVLLCEQADLAAGTSSASSRMIHGGLRYLEQFHFRLVREALAEREVLLSIAPHLVAPLELVLPHHRMRRPAWMIRVGLFLYDHLSHRVRLPGSYRIALQSDARGAGLQPHLRTGFVYSDCWVDDARLVVLNALDAARRGATVLTRTPCVKARREGSLWACTLRDLATGQERTVHGRALVNAAGPWMQGMMTDVVGIADWAHLTLSKGSHIVVPKLYEGRHGFLLQNQDDRVVFVLPADGFTMIGTTDVKFSDDPANARCSAEEVDYLVAAANDYFQTKLSSAEVVSSFAGVRPLYSDKHASLQEVSREYVLELDAPPGQAPLTSIIGGKITAYRQIGEKVLDQFRPVFPHLSGRWTEKLPLPGGDIPGEDVPAFIAGMRKRWPFLTEATAERMVRAYGTLVREILGDAERLEDLGRHFGADLYEAEVRYLQTQEWAKTADDILWRRSKLGLRFSAEEAAALETWLQPAGRPSLQAHG